MLSRQKCVKFPPNLTETAFSYPQVHFISVNKGAFKSRRKVSKLKWQSLFIIEVPLIPGHLHGGRRMSPHSSTVSLVSSPTFLQSPLS